MANPGAVNEGLEGISKWPDMYMYLIEEHSFYPGEKIRKYTLKRGVYTIAYTNSIE